MTNRIENKNGVKLLTIAMALMVALAGVVFFVNEESSASETETTIFVGGEDASDDKGTGAENAPYSTIEKALENKTGTIIIELKGNVTGNGVINPTGRNLTINFNDFIFNIDSKAVGSTKTETNGFQLLKDSVVTFNNGTITTSSNTVKTLIQNYSNLTLNEMTLDGTSLVEDEPNYTLGNNNGTVLIKDSKIIAKQGKNYAFDVCWYGNYEGANVTVEGSEIKGSIEISGNEGSGEKASLSLVDTTVEGDIIYNASKKVDVSIGKGVDVDIYVPKNTDVSGSIAYDDNKISFNNLKTDKGAKFSEGSVEIEGDFVTSTGSVITVVSGIAKLKGDVPAGTKVIISPTSTLEIPEGVNITNAGSIEVGGTLKVSGGITQAESSQIKVDEEAKLVVGGKITESSNETTITNNGTIQITNSEAELPTNINGNGTLDTSAVESEGTLSGEYKTNTTFTRDQVITATGDITLVAGTVFIFQGKLVIPEGMTLLVENGAKLILDGQAAVLENNGTIVIESKQSRSAEITIDGAFIVNQGTLNNNGTVELAYESKGSDAAGWTMNIINGGVVKNEGTINIGEDSQIAINSTVENNGTMNILGEIVWNNDGINAKTDASFKNSGVVVLSGTVGEPKDVTIYLTSKDAKVIIDGMTNKMNSSDFASISVSDEKYEEKGKELDEEESIITIEVGRLDSISGITISLTTTSEKVENTTTNYKKLLIGGEASVSTIDEDDNPDVQAIITLVGDNLVSEKLSIPSEASLVVGGKLLVSGTVEYATKNGAGGISVTGTLDVTGTVTGNDIKVEGGTINAAWFETKVSNTSKNYTYTTLNAAAESGATKIVVSGTIEMSGEVVMKDGVTLDNTTGTITVKEDSTLTLASGSKLKNGTITVEGTLYIADVKGTKAEGTINSEVQKNGEKDKTYTNLMNAISLAQSGETIKLSDDAEISKSITLGAGVTLDTNNEDLTVKAGSVLTIDGTIFVNMAGGEGEFILDPETPSESGTRTIPAAKAIVNGTIYSNEEIDENLEIIGAYYTITDSKADKYYYVSPVATAAAGALGFDGYTINIRTFGDDLSLGDISFIGASKKTIVVNVVDEGTLTAKTITLDYATFNVTGMKFTATLTNGVGTVIADGSAVDKEGDAAKFTVSSSTKDDVKILTVSGTFCPNNSEAETYEDLVYLALEGDVTVDNLITTTIQVTGNVLVTGDGSKAIIVKVEGAFTIENDAAFDAEIVTVFGSLVVKDATDAEPEGALSVKTLLVGLDLKDIVDYGTGANASVAGNVDIDAYLFVADGCTVPAELIEGVDSITFYVEGKAWMTVYDVGGEDGVVINNIPVNDAKLEGWTVGEKTFDRNVEIPFDGNLKAEAKINYKVFEVTVRGSVGVGDIYIDGTLVKDSRTSVAAGKHTVSFTPAVGYSNSGVMYVNGEKATGFDFTVTGDVTTYNIVIQDVQLADPTPTPVTPVTPASGDDDMGLTEYLLIVLVILAAILVIVVAVRMMRS